MPAGVRDRVEADRERLRRRVADWITAFLAGRGRSELDPQVLAHAFVACAGQCGRTALTEPRRFDPEHVPGRWS
ncbi:hypothetical protein [Streptomyces flavochromogenes]|uniref:hypothetical protein n=1 Tax=Streptomyces flavochromogenes TaxID=68199 RepID=UPI0004C1161C|nr:hypothetical protein [Streptomyces flavochromogenes]